MVVPRRANMRNTFCSSSIPRASRSPFFFFLPSHIFPEHLQHAGDGKGRGSQVNFISPYLEGYMPLVYIASWGQLILLDSAFIESLLPHAVLL